MVGLRTTKCWEQPLSLSVMFSPLPPCIGTANVANQDDNGCEVTVSTNCSDHGMTTACDGPSSNANKTPSDINRGAGTSAMERRLVTSPPFWILMASLLLLLLSALLQVW